MKKLFFIALFFSAMSPLLSQDGLPILRGDGNYYIDDTIRRDMDFMVVRWRSIQSNGFGPLGASSYKGEIEVTHRLHGQYPQKIRCSFFFWTLHKSDSSLPKSFVQPKMPVVGDKALVLGTYHSEKQSLEISRYLEPSQENLELVGSLIRQYKAKELAADPKAAEMLDTNLAAALTDAKAREAPQVVASTTAPQASPTSFPYYITAVIALLVVALLIFAGRFWSKRRVRIQ